MRPRRRATYYPEAGHLFFVERADELMEIVAQGR